MLSGETITGLKMVFLAKDGTSIPVEGNVNCRFEGQRPLLIRCIFRDIKERKKALDALRLNEERLEALLKLSQMTEASEKEISDFALEEGVRLTESKIGYLHFFNEDQKSLQLYSWSKGVLE